MSSSKNAPANPFNAPRDMHVAIVRTLWNSHITERLLEGALTTFKENGIGSDDIDVFEVPGAVELTFASAKLVDTGLYNAIIILGCVIRGGTPHFDYVCKSVTQGNAYLNSECDIPFPSFSLSPSRRYQGRVIFVRAYYVPAPEPQIFRMGGSNDLHNGILIQSLAQIMIVGVAAGIVAEMALKIYHLSVILDQSRRVESDRRDTVHNIFRFAQKPCRSEKRRLADKALNLPVLVAGNTGNGTHGIGILNRRIGIVYRKFLKELRRRRKSIVSSDITPAIPPYLVYPHEFSMLELILAGKQRIEMGKLWIISSRRRRASGDRGGQ